MLESEFDVRILDEGVVKMFRMAQLAIEYQQFCRHYLDRSVFVLREEITALAQVGNSSFSQRYEYEVLWLTKITWPNFAGTRHD